MKNQGSNCNGYKTVKSPAEGRLSVEKSEFIASLSPVSSEEEAVAFIEDVRSRNRKARHNCYAYALREGFITRYSDDGEPQGTAGLPILDVIQKNELSDVCIVVTRYFGGVLLGRGGLTRAYSTAASSAVSVAEISLFESGYIVTIVIDYNYYQSVAACLIKRGVKTLSSEYSDKVKLSVSVRAELYSDLYSDLTDTTNGTAKISKSDELLIDFSC